MRKYILALFVFMSAACSAQKDAAFCPNIQIPRASSYLTQRSPEGEVYIELYGYKGYCFYDESHRQNRAVITPLFKISRTNSRLAQEADISYFIDNGRFNRAFNETIVFTTENEEQLFEGKPQEIRLNSAYEGGKIFLRLALSKADKIYNDQIFDLGFEPALKNSAQPEKVNSCRSCGR